MCSLRVARVTEIHIEGNPPHACRAILREMRTKVNGYYNAQTLEAASAC